MKFNYNQDKNVKLLAQRSLGFEEIIEAIANGNLLQIRNHHNQKLYPNQKNFLNYNALLFLVSCKNPPTCASHSLL